MQIGRHLRPPGGAPRPLPYPPGRGGGAASRVFVMSGCDPTPGGGRIGPPGGGVAAAQVERRRGVLVLLGAGGGGQQNNNLPI